MELGSGIALAGSVSAITIPMATVIIAIVKRQDGSNAQSTCAIHPSIEAALDRIERALEKRSEDLWDAITTIQQDIKQLLSLKLGG